MEDWKRNRGGHTTIRPRSRIPRGNLSPGGRISPPHFSQGRIRGTKGQSGFVPASGCGVKGTILMGVWRNWSLPHLSPPLPRDQYPCGWRGGGERGVVSLHYDYFVLPSGKKAGEKGTGSTGHDHSNDKEDDGSVMNRKAELAKNMVLDPRSVELRLGTLRRSDLAAMRLVRLPAQYPFRL
ncbi:hypothetical protein CH063_05013 [Colletotrichum higginsianum]|uniref:Uncharacterized protein n=1 Tax=Colletotrichum higginsianum (strain IMI 349063) TaxID=759273 RepID=H1UXH2_COLHI|nr:hypothetical protein CH063_05013 [Colletotrichum higginsianum]